MEITLGSDVCLVIVDMKIWCCWFWLGSICLDPLLLMLNGEYLSRPLLYDDGEHLSRPVVVDVKWGVFVSTLVIWWWGAFVSTRCCYL